MNKEIEERKKKWRWVDGEHPDMDKITDRQRQVLDFVVKTFKKTFLFPTHREVMGHFRWKSTNSVSDHYYRLERKGYVWLDESTRGRLLHLTSKTKNEYGLFWVEDEGVIAKLKEENEVLRGIIEDSRGEATPLDLDELEK